MNKTTNNNKKRMYVLTMYVAGRIDKYYRQKPEDIEGMYFMLKNLYPKAYFVRDEEVVDLNRYK